jgi:hypothetical protein
MKRSFMATESTAPLGQPASDRRAKIGVLVAVVAVVALVVGGIAGWLLRGDDDTSVPAFVAGLGDTVVIGGEETNRDALTDRQLAMVEVARGYVNAWIENDGDAVTSFMTSDGYVELPDFGQTFRVDDGTLQEWVEGPTSVIPNELNDPLVVSGSQVVLVGYAERVSSDWMITLKFTESGDVKIESDWHLAV